MSAINESIGRVLCTPGVRAVALIDMGTGMVVGSAGDTAIDLMAAAPGLAEEVRLTVRAHGQSVSADAATVTAVTPRSLYLTKILEYSRGEGLLLYADIDLAQTNVALATLQVDRLAPELLAP